MLPNRTKTSNKTSAGKVLIIGGGKGLYGAGILSALAATRTGAGYTHLMTDLTKFPWIKFPDFILHPIKISELKNKEEFAIGIGPGLGIEDKNKKLINYLIKNNFKKVVVDADALTLIANSNFPSLPPTWILTPHEGELARLLKTTSSLIKKDRLKAIKEAQAKFNCTVLLKGAATLIATPNSPKILSIQTGTPALSKAGTGDVLLGMIVALRAQGLDTREACLVATYIHGKAAREWGEEGNDHLSLRPTDLIERLPKTIKLIRFKK
ncbi:MAG: NAD(P)H-hydrate dehydratase [Bacteriovorax sp.]|nr:NAD(P)H-hydrate dehydratase [Bacteriovorax sp.]